MGLFLVNVLLLPNFNLPKPRNCVHQSELRVGEGHPELIPQIKFCIVDDPNPKYSHETGTWALAEATSKAWNGPVSFEHV